MEIVCVSEHLEKWVMGCFIGKSRQNHQDCLKNSVGPLECGLRRYCCVVIGAGEWNDYVMQSKGGRFATHVSAAEQHLQNRSNLEKLGAFKSTPFQLTFQPTISRCRAPGLWFGDLPWQP